ncbi:hypothetical protein P691DRAFT_787186 [Macrolepiota fuliginosa MF-IS2]|uniref:Uncharacterized protein n=1 Tax=Macrolepiota fuliginosa MF-IS2 TaxID=1400762 RepID=A0A9P5X5N2_9AGAR|nr:hypothetical protein P691DRAFT_787186 [Macrolepiota fuliginosa MF-IS2]
MNVTWPSSASSELGVAILRKELYRKENSIYKAKVQAAGKRATAFKRTAESVQSVEERDDQRDPLSEVPRQTVAPGVVDSKVIEVYGWHIRRYITVVGGGYTGHDEVKQRFMSEVARQMSAKLKCATLRNSRYFSAGEEKRGATDVQRGPTNPRQNRQG